MTVKRIGGSLIMVLLAASLVGCCCGGDKETVVVPTAPDATLGKKLEDLKSAYDKGALSEDEYKKAREQILKEGSK